jgi:hypothetical protein
MGMATSQDYLHIHDKKEENSHIFRITFLAPKLTNYRHGAPLRGRIGAHFVLLMQATPSLLCNVE